MLQLLTLAHLAHVQQIDAATNPHPWTSSQWLDSLESHHCYGWWQAEQLVGFAVCMQTLDEAELLLIAIAPAWQKKQLGSQLIQAVLRELNCQGVLKLFLEVRESNTAAGNFYLRHQFEQVGRRKGYYPTSVGREDALLYTYTILEST